MPPPPNRGRTLCILHLIDNQTTCNILFHILKKIRIKIFSRHYKKELNLKRLPEHHYGVQNGFENIKKYPFLKTILPKSKKMVFLGMGDNKEATIFFYGKWRENSFSYPERLTVGYWYQHFYHYSLMKKHCN